MNESNGFDDEIYSNLPYVSSLPEDTLDEFEKMSEVQEKKWNEPPIDKNLHYWE